MSEMDVRIRERGSAALLDGTLRYGSLSRSGSRFELRLLTCEGAERKTVIGHPRRVLEMLLRGYSQKVIALELGVSVATVSTLMRVGLQRLGVPCWQHMLLAAAFLDRAAIPLDGTERDGWEEVDGGAACVLRLELSSALLVLTDAEREVVLAAAEGSSNQQIACGTNKSVRTVANQLASAFRKLGARGRAELLRCIAQEPLSLQ